MDGDHQQIFQQLVNNDQENTHIINGIDEFSLDDSIDSVSSNSSDLLDDASSSSSNGPLYELSEALMSHLPIKRGLSKYYEGRSQSFTSLESVKSGEDLAKKGVVMKRRRRVIKMKSRGGLIDNDDNNNNNNNNKLFSPNNKSMVISKKGSTSFLISSFAHHHHHRNNNKRGDFAVVGES